MAETPDRPKRPGGPPKGSRPDSARPAKGRSGGERPQRDDRPQRDGERRDQPRREGERPYRPRAEGDKPAWQKRDSDGPAQPRRDGDRPERPSTGRPSTGRPSSGRPSADRAGSGRPSSERPSSERPRSEHPRRDGDRPDRPRFGDRPQQSRPQRSGDRPSRPGEGEKRLWTREGQPARGDKDARERETPEDRDPFGLRAVRNRHEDPIIPDDVEAKELDRVARAQLKTLSKDNAEGVAQHLVMVARLIDENPALAHEHAISAARRAGRIAVVRETLAITAYSVGDYALALRELRTYRRISGKDDQLPVMVDSERGLGRPEKALELGRSVPRASLPVAVQVELAIVMSGARLDLGQTEAALVELQIRELDPDTAFSWSPGLFDAYATVLEDLGRAAEAEEWFARSDRARAALESGDDEDDEESTIEVFEEDAEESIEGPLDSENSGHGVDGETAGDSVD